MILLHPKSHQPAALVNPFTCAHKACLNNLYSAINPRPFKRKTQQRTLPGGGGGALQCQLVQALQARPQVGGDAVQQRAGGPRYGRR